MEVHDSETSQALLQAPLDVRVASLETSVIFTDSKIDWRDIEPPSHYYRMLLREGDWKYILRRFRIPKRSARLDF